MSLLWIYSKGTYQSFTIKDDHKGPIMIGPSKQDRFDRLIPFPLNMAVYQAEKARWA